MAPRSRNRLGAPTFEPEVFRKQMHSVEEGTFAFSAPSTVIRRPENCAPLVASLHWLEWIRRFWLLKWQLNQNWLALSQKRNNFDASSDFDSITAEADMTMHLLCECYMHKVNQFLRVTYLSDAVVDKEMCKIITKTASQSKQIHKL